MRDNPSCASPYDRALAEAILRSDLEACRAALRRGADPNANAHGGSAGDVMLTYAIACDFTEGAKLLLKSGASLSGSPCGRRLPFVLAGEVGNLKIARELLKRGADPRSANVDGWTALHHAARRGDAAFTELIKPQKADAHALNRAGETPMHLAARSTYGGPVEVLRLLVDAGGSSSFTPDSPRLGYLTPFQTAVRHGTDEQITFFMEECGEDESQVTLSGKTMEELAPFESVEALLRSAASTRAIAAAMDTGESSPSKLNGCSPL